MFEAISIVRFWIVAAVAALFFASMRRQSMPLPSPKEIMTPKQYLQWVNCTGPYRNT
jgi:hypothetical protein